MSLRLEVKDLEHWECSTTPVFAVRWAVDRRAGYWVEARDVLRSLDEAKAGWRAQGTVTVALPVLQDTSDDGLRALRLRAARWVSPLFRSDGKGAFNLTFDLTTEEGRSAQARWVEFLDRGGAIEFGPDTVHRVRLPDQLHRLYGFGEDDPFWIKFQSRPPDLPPLRVRFVASRSGLGPSTEFGPVTLRRCAGGRRMTTFESDDDWPLHLRLQVPTDGSTASMDWSLNPRSTPVGVAHQVTQFMDVLSNGAVVTVLDQQTGAPYLRGEMSLGASGGLDAGYSELLAAIVRIGHHFGVALVLPEGWGIGCEDEAAAHMATAAITTGSAELSVSGAHFRGILLAPQAPQRGECLSFELPIGEQTVSLLGQALSLGPCTLRGRGTVTSVRRLKPTARRPSGAYTVAVQTTELCQVFDRWAPDPGCTSVHTISSD